MSASPYTSIAITPKPSRPIALALTVILAAQLMLQMDFLIVMVALPRIQGDLAFSAATISWVPNAFALAFGGLLLLGGRLGDAFGRVRAFQVGIALFVVASLLGGLAQDAFMLVSARVLQGAGAALAAPSVLALITNIARDDAERNRGLGLFIAVSSVGASAGLILGGWLTEYWSWRWSLLINVPVGVVVLLLIGRLVVETDRQPSTFDVGGALTATLGSIALVYGFIHAAEQGWGSAVTFLSFAAAAVLLGLFWQIERRIRQPLLDLNLVRNSTRLRALAIMALIVGVHFSLLFILVQYLQTVLGFAPLVAGLAYLPVTCTVFAFTHFMPALITRFSAERLQVTGCVMVALSFLSFAFIGEHSTYFGGILGPMLVHSVGIALVFTPGTVLTMHDVPAEHSGSVSGLLQMDQQIGGALGIAIITAVLSAASQPGNIISGLPLAFGAAALLALFAAVVAWPLMHQRTV